MDNREGIQPDSLNPLPGATPANTNGKPDDALREGFPPAPSIDTDSAPADEGFFTTSNLVMLGMLGALFVFLVVKFSFEELWNIVKAALGLSFVIFIHELGHFLAAKWCGVNVTTFSIGFGPAVPGCWFQWGETTYKLAILPLGGYVQMVGQVDGDESADDEDDPRSYRKKSVGQRMLIISAGVIMNAILAVICFIAVYQGPGREHPSAVISVVDSNGPVFKMGVPTGADITKIGTTDKPTFTDLKYTVIFSSAGEKIPLTFQVPGKPAVDIEIESRKDKTDKLRAIGVAPPEKLQFASLRDSKEGPFYAGSPAAAAKFHADDLIVGMTDPDQADKVTPLPDDPRFPGKGQRDYFEFARRLQLLANQEIVLRVQRAGAETDVKVAPLYRLDLGIIMEMGPILAVRQGSDADAAVRGPRDVRDPKDESKVVMKLRGDFIYEVLVDDVGGKPLKFIYKDEANPLDPVRLPFQLRQWSDRLDKAKERLGKGERPVTLKLTRQVEKPFGDDTEKLTVTIPWDTNWRFDRVAPMSPNAPMPIPELGLAYQIQSSVRSVTDPNSKLKPGDIVKNIRLEVKTFKKDAEGDWIAKNQIEEGQWANISRILHGQFAATKLTFKVERNKETLEVDVPVVVDSTWPLANRGWLLASDTRVVKADNTWDAIRLGFSDTHNRMWEVFFTLRGIIKRDISPDVMGGPLTIAYGTYRFAGLNFGEFAFFLGLISINLAVVNFLPIPVLDGGHMVFLIYEKLRGQQASEAVRIWATYAGLAVILCLMMFVLYLDVNRLFF